MLPIAIVQTDVGLPLMWKKVYWASRFHIQCTKPIVCVCASSLASFHPKSLLCSQAFCWTKWATHPFSVTHYHSIWYKMVLQQQMDRCRSFFVPYLTGTSNDTPVSWKSNENEGRSDLSVIQKAAVSISSPVLTSTFWTRGVTGGAGRCLDTCLHDAVKYKLSV